MFFWGGGGEGGRRNNAVKPVKYDLRRDWEKIVLISSAWSQLPVYVRTTWTKIVKVQFFFFGASPFGELVRALGLR